MVFFPGLGGDMNVVQVLLSFGMLVVFFLLFPRIMLFQVLYKLRSAVTELEEYAEETETLFLQAVAGTPTPALRERMDPMKNMVVSPPTSLDPAGIVGKLEHTLDFSEDKMNAFVDDLAEGELDEAQRANLHMGFKGVYGTQQIYVLVRHFKELIEDTKNFQLGGMVQMMVPLYRELAESQHDATEAFVNGVPIGDAVGPLVAAKFMESEPEEAAEDIVVSEEDVDGTTVLVMKSDGPGARLGKYGDAIEELVEERDIGKMLFVDAGMRFEGEETGTVVDGAGVLMGGPGVEKFKIEEVAAAHDIPLEGFIVKQSGPQASKPMHSKIYEAVPETVERVGDAITGAEADTVLLVGVGNTGGVPNQKKQTTGIPNKLKPYWAEEEEEATSYFGLMKAFPVGGGGDAYGRLLTRLVPGAASAPQPTARNTFELFQRIARR